MTVLPDPTTSSLDERERSILMPESGPPDPSLSSADEIRAVVSEPSGSAATAAGLDFGPEEPSSKSAAIQAASALVDALGVEQARSSEAVGELAVSEVQSAIERGLDPSEVLAAGLSSRAISPEQADEIAWQSALAEQGLTEAELDEVDDDGWSLTEEIDGRRQELLAGATGLAEFEAAQRQAVQASENAFAQATANHAQSVSAMKALQAELQLSAPAFEDHLREIDAEVEGGILGIPVDLDRLAQNDPKLFAAALRSVSATLRESDAQFEGEVVKAAILGQSRDIADGLVIDGVPVKPPAQPVFDEEKFSNRVVQRSLGGSPFDGPVKLPASLDIKSGYTLGSKKVHPDDIPLAPDGLSARARNREAMKRGGRAS